MSSDGADAGIAPDRALKTIIGGDPAPELDDHSSAKYWRARLEAKDDNIGGYDAHAEVMAKYIMQAIITDPSLAECPISSVYENGPDGRMLWPAVVLVPDLSDVLKERVYADKSHPFRRALSEATGFTWGWAFNIAHYALGLPDQPNPAIIEIG